MREQQEEGMLMNLLRVGDKGDYSSERTKSAIMCIFLNCAFYSYFWLVRMNVLWAKEETEVTNERRIKKINLCRALKSPSSKYSDFIISSSLVTQKVIFLPPKLIYPRVLQKLCNRIKFQFVTKIKYALCLKPL